MNTFIKDQVRRLDANDSDATGPGIFQQIAYCKNVRRHSINVAGFLYNVKRKPKRGAVNHTNIIDGEFQLPCILLAPQVRGRCMGEKCNLWILISLVRDIRHPLIPLMVET